MTCSRAQPILEFCQHWTVKQKDFLGYRSVKIAPEWRSNIHSKKTHRFEPFEYLCLRIMFITGGQTKTTRHNYLYRYFQDTVPLWSPCHDAVTSLHMDEASFFVLLSAICICCSFSGVSLFAVSDAVQVWLWLVSDPSRSAPTRKAAADVFCSTVEY